MVIGFDHEGRGESRVITFWRRSRRALWPVLLLAAGCATAPIDLPVTRSDTVVNCCQTGASVVVFQYLGSGGWVISRGSDAVMTAPFFSNPGIFRVGLLRIAPNRKRIDEHLRRIDDLRSIDLVLAGHSHYDHLMDLPVVFESLPAGVSLFGDASMTHLLWNKVRVVSLVESAGALHQAGRWTRIGDVRFMAILSSHAAHWRGIKFFNGHYVQPLARAPRRAREWKEGEPLAFLIDFLSSDGTILFRVYYDDTAHNHPYGYPDAVTLTERRVDVAILTVASFHEVADYPDCLLQWLQPRHVLLGHWEDFFVSPDRPSRPVRLTNVSAFLARLKRHLPSDATWTLPERHVKVTFLY